MTNIQKPRNHRTNALLAQLLAQAEVSRLGERFPSLRWAPFT